MIYITGDTHNSYDGNKLFTFPRMISSKLTRDDYVIVCGDFGYVWFGDGRDDTALDRLEKKLPYTLLFIDGNHENFNVLNDVEKYPLTSMFGGTVQRIRPHIIHLMRGEIYEIEGKTFFTMGGAASQDKMYRTEGISWWPQEIPSPQEIDHAEKTLNAHDRKVDYILTHCMPTTCMFYAAHNNLIPHLMEPKDDAITEYLDSVMATVCYKHWFCGHYHTYREIPCHKLTALYHDFIRPEEQEETT